MGAVRPPCAARVRGPPEAPKHEPPRFRVVRRGCASAAADAIERKPIMPLSLRVRYQSRGLADCVG